MEYLKSDQARRLNFLETIKNRKLKKQFKSEFGIFVKLMIATVAVVLSLIVLRALFNEDSVHFEIVQPVQAEVYQPEYLTVQAQVTAYTSSVEETDDTPFITASGSTTKDGILACPPKYKFGTIIEIENKKFICQDRMNRRYHNQERFDIWFESKDLAYNWGLKELEIKVY